MNQTIDTIHQHRSIRQFTDQAIDADLLSSLFDCAIAASTYSFIQCVGIIRVTQSEIRQTLAYLAGGQPYVVSEQITDALNKEARPFMKGFINSKAFSTK